MHNLIYILLIDMFTGGQFKKLKSYVICTGFPTVTLDWIYHPNCFLFWQLVSKIHNKNDKINIICLPCINCVILFSFRWVLGWFLSCILHLDRKFLCSNMRQMTNTRQKPSQNQMKWKEITQFTQGKQNTFILSSLLCILETNCQKRKFGW